MKKLSLELFLIMFFLASCGTIQIGIEIPAAVTSPIATIPPTLVPTNTPSEPQMVQIFLIGVGDNGVSGPMIGCGDSLVPVQVEVASTQGILRASLSKLLSLKDAYYGQSGLYNALYQSNLQLDVVTLEAGKAVVQLSGSMMLGGVCDNPRVSAQLEATVRQFSKVSEVTIYLNGKLLADALSLK